MKDHPSLRNPVTLELCESFTLERRVPARGNNRVLGRLLAAPTRAAVWKRDLPHTFQARGVELDEELGLARRLQNGLDPFQLNPGFLNAHCWICATAQKVRQQCSVSTAGSSTTHLLFCATMTAPVLELSCDVTPTSKVAKTGEWSLEKMSSVQPGAKTNLLDTTKDTFIY